MQSTQPRDEFQVDPAGAVEADVQRVVQAVRMDDKLSFDAGDLHFDLSKNLIKPETLQLFVKRCLAQRIR